MRNAKWLWVCVVAVVACALTGTLASAETHNQTFGAPHAVAPWDDLNPVVGMQAPTNTGATAAGATAVMTPGDLVDLDAALAAAANYLRGMQADVTEDNAGNGSGLLESPNDPDDAGWDWAVTSPPAPFFHTTAASPKNLYGVTALGVYYAYLENNAPSYFTAMTDAANVMIADAVIRTSRDMMFLMLYNDLPGVVGTAYKDAAKAKFDARIAAAGSATVFAQTIRDVRGASYPNGIIGWDIGAYVHAASMLEAHYPADPYDYATAADDMAEVLWQDSFNDNPGLFDVVDDAGWDPTWTNVNYWWYTLGVSGLAEAFTASNTHTAEVPGLVARLLASQFTNGAVSGSYGANATDEDWQSTAYAAAALAMVDQPTHQVAINHMAYWIGATQDAVSGAWKYGDNSHYPEVGGENASALALGQPPTYVIVDDDFTSQADVDVYNTTNSTNYLWGYDAFGTVQDGVDGVSGSTVFVLPGVYEEQVEIAADITLTGSGQGVTIIRSPVSLTASFSTGPNNYPVIYCHDAGAVTIQQLTVDGAGRGNANYRFIGIAYRNAGGAVDNCEIKDIRNTPIDGSQHGVGLYAFANDGNPRTLTVLFTTISGFQKNGTVFAGADLSVAVVANTVTGAGPVNFIAQNGIQMSFGATGSITGNTVSGFSYTPATYVSCGVLVYVAASPVITTGNPVSESQVGIYYIDVDGDVSGNTLTYTAGGMGATPYWWGIVIDPGARNVGPKSQPFDEDLGMAAIKPSSSHPTAANAVVLNTTVNDNVLDGGGVGTGIEADVFSPEVLNFSADRNDVRHFNAGMVTYEDPGATLNGILIYNHLISNDLGLQNLDGTLDVQLNTFANTANADDNTAGNYYDRNCWSDFNGTPPYPVGGTGGNLDNHPNGDCGLETIVCPPDISVQCLADVPPCDPNAATVSHNCDPVIVTCSDGPLVGGPCGGTIARTYTASDACGNVVSCDQIITVDDNTPPVITCLPDITVQRFLDLPPCDSEDPTVTDNCGGNVSVICDRSSLGGVGCTDSPIPVTYTYTATDACGNVSQCVRVVTVLRPDCPFVVSAGDGDGVVDAFSGQQLTLPIRVDTIGAEIAAFDLAVRYDKSAVTVLGVDRGTAVQSWEYFTYRLESTSDGSGVIRLVGVADLNNGAAHPPYTAFMPIGEVAQVRLAVSSDPSYAARSLTLSPCLNGCTDNTVVSRDGAMTFVMAESNFESCASTLSGSVVPGVRFADLRLDISKPESVTGDLNLNGMSYEVGDVVLLTNYLINGPSALSADPSLSDLQLASSDVNNDGVLMTVADLRFLLRVISGEAAPIAGAKLSPFASRGQAHYQVDNGQLTVSTESEVELGGVYFIFRNSGLSVGSPTLQSDADGLTIRSSAVNGEFRVLVSPEVGQMASVGAGRKELFTVPVTGDGSIELIEVQMSDAAGALLLTTAYKSVLPTDYALEQNYPNPFNAGTVIPFALKDASDWTLTVYNVMGQVVRTFAGHNEAGRSSVNWDGSDQSGTSVASGMYFYRIQTEHWGATKKMTLVK